MCPNFPWALDKLPGCCAQLPQASLEGKCSGPMGSQFRPLLEGILHQTGQILTQYVNLVGLKHVFGLKGLFSGESEMSKYTLVLGSQQVKREEKAMDLLDLPQGLRQTCVPA